MKKKKEISTYKIDHLLNVAERISYVKDIDALLDRILLESRRLVNADAGSIFLVDSKTNKLKFSYVQNDSLFNDKYENKKYLYVNTEISIDKKSIAGYVALTGHSLLIDDVYSLPSDVPYSFNSTFDKKASYRTKSVLAMPLKTNKNKIVGVIQIINPKNRKGEIVTFTQQDEVFLRLFSNNAAVAIEKAKLTREMILNMIKMSELRDPGETGNHVKRVGAYAVEIYERWATKHNIDSEKIKEYQDDLKIAAMLHDVGKVAISDLILKKPGKLTDEEFNVMKLHTILGARLFTNSQSEELTKMSMEVALNHHEKWDGTGYPGKIKDLFADDLELGKGKKEEDIPLCGRIVALADVYDALSSKRVYKEAWEEKRILEYINSQSGKHFDPEIVEAFLSIHEVIDAIKRKYS